VPYSSVQTKAALRQQRAIVTAGFLGPLTPCQVVVARDGRAARDLGEPRVRQEYHDCERTSMSLPSARSSVCLVVLLIAVVGCVSPAFPAEPARPASEASAACASPERSGHTDLPYQLWPAEVVSADGIVVSGSEQASKAGARCAAATTISTLVSPTLRRPKR